MKEAMIFTFLF
jgi:hypothetical protein